MAILQLLNEEPMHGYQLMQAIGDRSGGRWTPSPGAIYPAINLLEDEGLVTVAAESGRKLVTLTDAGRERAASDQASRQSPFADFDPAESGIDLREQVEQVRMAARQVAHLGSDDQTAAAAKILTNARKELYLLLAEGTPRSE
jgi:DNA-binding PadR family transcriptional regulator